MTRTIYHIRHGETDWNAAGRLQGGRDIPLNDRGRRQADGNGRALGAHFSAIQRDPSTLTWIASPLGRTRETMERVRRGAGLEPSAYATHPDLREVSFGRYEGLTYADLDVQAPRAAAELRRDKWNFVPPDGESYAMLIARVGGFLAGTSGDLVIVSHGGVFRVLRALIEESEDHELAHLFVPQDRIFRWQDRHGAWL
ncbi:histidine phosphatase family protein [Siculibacillus lacustris]|uniref:histidine phosphatase family protein n=1 Tax=Siculibacillus lacustris TaxID=1549641 RepID=UPI001D18B8C8|nr:histidine phosphatase family protein [Siculibacillus lacustris]